VGKRAVGLELARALLCPEGGDSACEDCATCRKTRRMVHPDLHVLFPYPKDTDDEDVGERIQRLGENPYAAIDYVRRPSLSDPSASSNKQVMYHIDRIHDDLLRPMSFRPMEGSHKIALITDVEHMNETAANAFLKLLEEPPPRTVFVLTTSRPEQLLPTIVSRCQRLRFEPLAPDAIEAALIDREGMEEGTAAMLARMADGSYTYALDLAENEELMASRDAVLDFFRAAYMRNIDRINELVDEMKGQGRERVKGTLQLMLRWMRDLLLYTNMGEEAPLINVDQKQAIAQFCDNLPDANLQGMVHLVEDALHLTQRNVRLGLILTVLAQQLSHAMRGAPVDRLYVPLPEAELQAA
jgi:DNA polymerase-3 subunit delta'